MEEIFNKMGPDTLSSLSRFGFFTGQSHLKGIIKVSAVADKNAGLVKIDRKSVEWHCGFIAIPVLEVNSRGVDGLENR